MGPSCDDARYAAPVFGPNTRAAKGVLCAGQRVFPLAVAAYHATGDAGEPRRIRTCAPAQVLESFAAGAGIFPKRTPNPVPGIPALATECARRVSENDGPAWAPTPTPKTTRMPDNAWSH